MAGPGASKLSLVISSAHQFEVVQNRAEYLLKPSPEEFKFLAENEHASMLVMQKLGFSVPPFGLTRFQADEHGEEELAFIIKRFDREEDGTSLHQEQMDAAMGISEKYGKIQGDGESYISYERIGQFLRDNVDTSLAQKQDFYKRVIVSYLIGNNDLHLRNFGLLYPGTKRCELAPVYDYVSVAPYPEFLSGELALPLLIREEGGKETGYGHDTGFGQYIGYDFIQFGLGIGLSHRAAVKYLNDILKKAHEIKAVYLGSLLPETMTTPIIGCISQRERSLKEMEYHPL